MADDFQAYKVASNEQSSSAKFNNLVQAVQDAVNSIDNSNISAAGAIAVSKLAAGSSGDTLRTTAGVPTWTSTPATPVAPTMLPALNNDTATLTLGANNAFLAPIPNVIFPTVISRITYLCTTSNGNIDVGIYYSDDEVTFTKLFAQGTFASPGTGMQTKTLSAAQTITPVTSRRWYYAIATDSASFAIRASNTGASSALALGWTKATSFVLPTTIATPTLAQSPVMVGQV
jgi:hypothetical protein